jgi:hypothetical protein
MRTNAEEVRDEKVTSLLLFVRRAGDLARACRDAEELFASRRCHRDASFTNGRVLGAWIDERAVTKLPQGLTLRLPNRTVLLAVRETFALWGIWTITLIESMCLETKTDMELSHDIVLDALIAFEQSGVGRYSPAFVRGTPKKQVGAEIKRLNTNYPFRIAWPIYYDSAAGRLILHNERLHH